MLNERESESLEMDSRDALREEARDLVAAAERRLGRPVRMLHVGNIANNAYNNAKMMRGLGIDCDVLCIDYYHIMGTPEWEDADISGVLDDQFQPDWTQVDLGGFERPEWFVQGPLGACLDYLSARRRNASNAVTLWHRLGFINRTRRTTVRESLRSGYSMLVYKCERLLRLLLTPERAMRRLRDLGYPACRKLERMVLSTSRGRRVASTALGRFLYSLPLRLDRLMVAFVRSLHAVARRVYRRFRSATVQSDELARLHGHQSQVFHELFPERDDALLPEDILTYARELPRWREVLQHYDVVQGYGTDPIALLLAGAGYYAFEHGTLRELPFRPDALGRLTALAFHQARHVFVSNSDCVANAHRLAGDRVSSIPHPFDEERMERVSGVPALRAALCAELDADFLVFFPTRQDWVAGTGFADKANDRLLRAFARLREDGHRVGMVLCEWGKNVDESKDLLIETGCARFVKWTAPMCLVQYDRMMVASDVVADQFLLGAFGGVTFRALASGTPVCTYLHEDEVAKSFGSCPPTLNARSEGDIVEVLEGTLRDREQLHDIGQAARTWLACHHSGIGTVVAQLRVMLPPLAGTGAPR